MENTRSLQPKYLSCKTSSTNDIKKKTLVPSLWAKVPMLFRVSPARSRHDICSLLLRRVHAAVSENTKFPFQIETKGEMHWQFTPSNKAEIPRSGLAKVFGWFRSRGKIFSIVRRLSHGQSLTTILSANQAYNHLVASK